MDGECYDVTFLIWTNGLSNKSLSLKKSLSPSLSLSHKKKHYKRLFAGPGKYLHTLYLWFLHYAVLGLMLSLDFDYIDSMQLEFQLRVITFYRNL